LKNKKIYVWKTKGGVEIPITEMTTTHLQNAIKFMKSREESFKAATIAVSETTANFLQGDHAIMDSESFIQMEYEKPARYFLPKIYRAMVRELNRRNKK